MRRLSHTSLLALLGAWLLPVLAAHAMKPLVRDMCEVKLEPLNKATVGVPFEVRVTVSALALWPCNSVIMDVVNEERSATCVGTSSWTFAMDSIRPFVTTTSVELNPNDTSYIVFRVLCPEVNSKGQRYGEGHRLFFVTTEDDVKITDRCPWDAPQPWPDWRDQPRGGFPVPGEFPLDDSLWGILKVDPVSLPRTAGPVDLRIQFAPARHPCASVIFSIKTVGGLSYTGDSTWVRNLEAGLAIDTVISVVVPDSVRAAIYVGMKCGEAYHRVERRFFTIDDTLAYYAVHPWHESEVPSLYERVKVDTVRDVLLDSINALPGSANCSATITVKDSTQLAYAKSLGIELEPAGIEFGRAAYRCRTSKDNLIKLQKQQILIRFDRPSKDSDAKKGGENKKDEASPFKGEVHDTLQSSSSVSPTALPDLAICFPNGWEFPAVPSGRRYTLVSGDLWAGETTFVDWCVDNESNAPIITPYGFEITVSVENTHKAHTYYEMGAWREFRVYDDVVIPTNVAGWRLLTLEADPNLMVTEVSDDNNIFQYDFYWNPAEITYRGYL